MTNEYIRKADAVEALDGKVIVTGHENADAVLQYMKDISNKIKSLPPADVVPVVRCKDCKSCCRDDTQDWYWCERGLIAMKVRPDAFCSYGERREE